MQAWSWEDSGPGGSGLAVPTGGGQRGGVDWPEWDELVRRAREVVDATSSALPDGLRDRSRDVALACEPEPGPDIVADGWPEDLLGLFVGDPFGVPESERGPIPPRIFLYLDNLWDFAGGDDGAFREEVRITYLHELGHYLGLDEDEIEERGLG